MIIKILFDEFHKRNLTLHLQEESNAGVQILHQSMYQQISHELKEIFSTKKNRSYLF
jgi:hypothetical protein